MRWKESMAEAILSKGLYKYHLEDGGGTPKAYSLFMAWFAPGNGWETGCYCDTLAQPFTVTKIYAGLSVICLRKFCHIYYSMYL